MTEYPIGIFLSRRGVSTAHSRAHRLGVLFESLLKKGRLLVTEKTALAQHDYTPDNPEREWSLFQNAMRRSLNAPEKLDDNSKPNKVSEQPAQFKLVRNMNLNG